MRSSTIILAELALRHRGVRAAARASDQAVSSIGAALTRLEQDLGVPLVRRNEDGLALTINAQRRAPAIARLANLCRKILNCADDDFPPASLSFVALFRLNETLRVGSIRRAALQMDMAQPQLTRQISQLERILDRKLLVRGQKGVEPAPDARALLKLIEELETEWRALVRSGESSSSQISRSYVLGTIIPAGPFSYLATFLSELASDLLLKHGLRISIASTLAEDLLIGLDTRRFDCIFLDAELADPAYSMLPVQSGKVTLVGRDLPADIHDKDALRHALTSRPLVLQSRRSGLRQRAEAFLDLFAGEDWRSLCSPIEVDSLPLIVNMAHSGSVLSFLPVYMAPQKPDIVTLTLPDAFDETLNLAWRRTPKGRRLANIIRKALEEKGWQDPTSRAGGRR